MAIVSLHCTPRFDGNRFVCFWAMLSHTSHRILRFNGSKKKSKTCSAPPNIEKLEANKWKKLHLYHISGWWFGTLFFPIQLGMSLFQLTSSYFSEG